MLEKYQLLKTQKNQVFKILQQTGLEPADFSWTLTQSAFSRVSVSRLNYRDARFYFQFDFSANPASRLSIEEKHSCEFSPGDSMPISREYPGSWRGQLGYVFRWVKNLKKEIEAPDLWDEMEKYRTSVSIAMPEQLLNESISANEAEEIAEKLSSLADKIEEQFKLTDEQNQFVRGKLNYLAETAKRQRSVDWVHTSIGVFITMAMGLALAPDRAKELWQLFETVFGRIIHLIGG